jgi:multidrug efflux pump subunit AcrA (membrane-fusion protein)
MQDNTATAQALSNFLSLSRRARHAESDRELAFLMVNETHALTPYRQAALWLSAEGIFSLSGVVQIEANAPYVHWLTEVCEALKEKSGDSKIMFSAEDLPSKLADEWGHWWPSHAVCLPVEGAGFCLFVRDEPWSNIDLTWLGEWLDVWRHAFAAKHVAQLNSWRAWRAKLAAGLAGRSDRAWWRQARFQLLAAGVCVLLFPVYLTVLAPGELVPAHPVVVRAPVEGVVEAFHVQPNQAVKKDQPLFGFDEALIQSRVEVARQALVTAETEYRQTSQQALIDPKSKAQLASLMGRVEEKRAEVSYLNEQLKRSRVLAPKAGLVLMDDPAEWIGKPVAVGERVLRIAAAGDLEVEVWVPLSDAIALPKDASVTLYLNASPLSPVSARLRYMAHEAVTRPEGYQAYRARAVLTQATQYRVGLKGTAKLQGERIPLVYWMMRRPLAMLRSYLGY